MSWFSGFENIMSDSLEMGKIMVGINERSAPAAATEKERAAQLKEIHASQDRLDKVEHATNHIEATATSIQEKAEDTAKVAQIMVGINVGSEAAGTTQAERDAQSARISRSNENVAQLYDGMGKVIEAGNTYNAVVNELPVVGAVNELAFNTTAALAGASTEGPDAVNLTGTGKFVQAAKSGDVEGMQENALAAAGNVARVGLDVAGAGALSKAGKAAKVASSAGTASKATQATVTTSTIANQAKHIEVKADESGVSVDYKFAGARVGGKINGELEVTVHAKTGNSKTAGAEINVALNGDDAGKVTAKGKVGKAASASISIDEEGANAKVAVETKSKKSIGLNIDDKGAGVAVADKRSGKEASTNIAVGENGPTAKFAVGSKSKTSASLSIDGKGPDIVVSDKRNGMSASMADAYDKAMSSNITRKAVLQESSPEGTQLPSQNRGETFIAHLPNTQEVTQSKSLI